jgi:hypothetical protein
LGESAASAPPAVGHGAACLGGQNHAVAAQDLVVAGDKAVAWWIKPLDAARQLAAMFTSGGTIRRNQTRSQASLCQSSLLPDGEEKVLPTP